MTSPTNHKSLIQLGTYDDKLSGLSFLNAICMLHLYRCQFELRGCTLLALLLRGAHLANYLVLQLLSYLNGAIEITKFVTRLLRWQTLGWLVNVTATRAFYGKSVYILWLLSDLQGFTCWISFAPVFSWCTVETLSLLYLLLISWFTCSRRWCMDTSGVFHANQTSMFLIHIWTKGEVDAVKPVKALQEIYLMH